MLLLSLYFVLYHTSIGLAVRAGIEDPVMVGLLGTHVRRVFLIAFVIGAIAAGIAGAIYAPLAAVIPDMGSPFLVEAFVVVVIGGLGSFGGAVVGGIVVGELLSLTTLLNPLDRRGVITGNFTVRSASDLALLLRAGALPAPLTTLEERTIGPGLGTDSIGDGELSCLVGVALVAVFMMRFYGRMSLCSSTCV